MSHTSSPASAKSGAQLPEVDSNGFYHTLNQYGWSKPELGMLSEHFTRYASESPLWSLDIGCAYGFHTVAAIKAGARVVANDLSADHLRILTSQLPPSLSLNLRTRRGRFQKVALPAGAFGTILAANVLHFMDVPELEKSLHKMFKLLAPGGKVIVSAQTPYVATMTRFIPVYEQRKAAGEKWPGVIPDPGVYVEKRSPYNSGMAHLLEPDVLARGFTEAGFVVDLAEFGATMMKERALDGRERTRIMAHKP